MTSVLLSGATVMRDGTTPVASEPHDILVTGDRIAAIERAGTIAQADQRIDAEGLVVASPRTRCPFFRVRWK